MLPFLSLQRFVSTPDSPWKLSPCPPLLWQASAGVETTELASEIGNSKHHAQVDGEKNDKILYKISNLFSVKSNIHALSVSR